MRDYPEKLRMIARRQTLLRDEWERVLLGSADEIERLRDALRQIAHAPHGKVFCRDGHEEAFLIARAALGEDK
jgi:hypothetical protein